MAPNSVSTPCTALVPRASQSTNIHGVLLLILPALSPTSAPAGATGRLDRLPTARSGARSARRSPRRFRRLPARARLPRGRGDALPRPRSAAGQAGRRDRARGLHDLHTPAQAGIPGGQALDRKSVV